MKILFYYDPVTHKNDSLWRRAHVGVDRPIYEALIRSGADRDVHVKMMMNARYEQVLEEHGIACHDTVFVEEGAFLEPFADKHADINRLWFEQQYTAEQLERTAALVRNRLGGFVPDVVVSWTPAPFFSQINPQALVLHKEMGLFQRSPYPPTYFLDPLGYYGRSLLTRRITELRDGTFDPCQREALASLRQHFHTAIDSKSPFKEQIAALRQRFDHLLLLPLQYNQYFTFDSVCPYRSQAALAEAVLEKTPQNVGVILTSHRYGALSEQELAYLCRRFPNLIHIDSLNDYQNPSDLILPYVDAVVTVTSTLGLKALFWRKKLITVGRSYLDWLDDGNDLNDLARVLKVPYHPAKDRALAWFLFCYSIPQHYNGEGTWISDFLGDLLTTYRERGADALFREPIADPARLTRDYIARTGRNFPTANDEARLARAVGRLSSDEKRALIRGALAAPHPTPAAGAAAKPAAVVHLPTAAPKPPAAVKAPGAASGAAKPRIAVLYASGRWNASGLYLQDLCRNLVQLGAACMVVAEGDIPSGGEEDGVLWRQFAFDGYLLARELKREIIAFNPDLVYVINVRLKPMRAALELHVATGAKIAMQSEDDDLVVFKKFYRNADEKLLQICEKPKLKNADIRNFLGKIDWSYTIELLSGERPYRDVEPVLRQICFRLSVLNTAIWAPYADLLRQSFGKPTLIVPPVIEMGRFDPKPLSPAERANILRRFKIDPDSLVVFVAGTIYDFSPEFETFLESLRLASAQARITLAIAGRSRVKVRPLVDKIVGKAVAFCDLGRPDDDDYYAMMRAADVIAAPGYPDRFNCLRLSSRLVKAMAFSKPIFTYRCGFGESLRDGEEAVLTDGTDPQEWADKLLSLADPKLRLKIGGQARRFAERHFDARPVAERLLNAVSPQAAAVPAATPKPAQKPAAAATRLAAAGRTNHGTPAKVVPFAKPSAFKRKVRKLLRDPKAFFADSRLGGLVLHSFGRLRANAATRRPAKRTGTAGGAPVPPKRAAAGN
jgi:glycosyltransferase involved in cell wall biosynthesis